MWWGPSGDKILFHEYNSSGYYTQASRDGGLYQNDLLIINMSSNFSYSGSMSSIGSGGGGGCFIATAAFGSPLAGQVEILRKFRDRYLLTNTLGQKFVAWYYRNGPVAADWIKDKPLAKAAVQAGLYPLIGFSFLLISGYLPMVTVGLLMSALVFLRLKSKKLGDI